MNTPTPSKQKNKSSLQILRDKYTFSYLEAEFDRQLMAEGLTRSDIKNWEPALCQWRISSADLKSGRGTSKSPEKQMKMIVRYMIRYKMYPADSCFEAKRSWRPLQMDERPTNRKLFEAKRLSIVNGELKVKHMITPSIDRFTRDPDVLSAYIKTLFRAGVGLHCAENLDMAPRSLDQCEAQYRKDVLQGWEESRNTQKRIQATFKEMVEEGRLLSGYPNCLGHDYIVANIEDEDGEASERRVGLEIREASTKVEADNIREAVEYLISSEDNRLNHVVRDWREREIKTRNGSYYTQSMLQKMFISPRLCGYQQLTIADQTSLHKANIEPIISKDDWEKLVAKLSKKKSYRARQEYPASGRGVCGVEGCESPIVGGRRAVGERNYKCSKKNIKHGQACTCSGGRGKCTCFSIGHSSADGHKHPTRLAEILERFLAVASLAVYEEGFLAEEATSANARKEILETEIGEASSAMESLDAERMSLLKQNAKGYLSDDELDKQMEPILAQIEVAREEIARVKEELGNLAEKIDPKDIRQSLNADGAAGTQALSELFAMTLDHYVLSPTTPDKPFSGIMPVFKDGYTVDKTVIEELADELNADYWKQNSLNSTQAADESLENKIGKMWVNNPHYTVGDICKHLVDTNEPTVRGGEWQTTTVTNIVKRYCLRHDTPFKARAGSRPSYSPEVRATIYELVGDRSGKGEARYGPVVQELEQMKIKTMDGQPWTWRRVARLYASECSVRGHSSKRKNTVPDSVKKQMKLKYKVEKKTYNEIAAWLNDLGIERSSGRPWTKQSVLQLFKLYDLR